METKKQFAKTAKAGLKKPSTWLLMLFTGCFMSFHQAVAQNPPENGGGTGNERWTLNNNDSNHWTQLRMQSNTIGWNMINKDGDFWWSVDPTTTHSNTGYERMRLTYDGKLGIGTTSPSTKLTVYDGDFTLQTDDNTQNQGILFQNSGNAYTWRMYRADAGNYKADLIFASGINLDFNQLQDRMVLKTDGNVGIGTISPTPGRGHD